MLNCLSRDMQNHVAELLRISFSFCAGLIDFEAARFCLDVGTGSVNEKKT